MGGKILTAILKPNGQKFAALDGGPLFKFNESVSFYVECQDQEEVDYFWKMSHVKNLNSDGLKDKYGLLQIILKTIKQML